MLLPFIPVQCNTSLPFHEPIHFSVFISTILMPFFNFCSNVTFRILCSSLRKCTSQTLILKDLHSLQSFQCSSPLLSRPPLHSTPPPPLPSVKVTNVTTFVTALVSTSHYLSPLVTACQFLSPLLTTCLHLSIFVSTSHYLSLLVNSCVTLVTFSVDMLATSSLCYIGTLQ